MLSPTLCGAINLFGAILKSVISQRRRAVFQNRLAVPGRAAKMINRYVAQLNRGLIIGRPATPPGAGREKHGLLCTL